MSALSQPSLGRITLQVPSVADRVYDELQSQITRKLRPGTALPLHGVASNLGVSVTPVRMAIARLVSDGLVVQEPRKGAVVAPMSLPDFMDIYAIRMGLEGMAARLGASELSDSESARIRSGVAALREARRIDPPGVDDYLPLEWSIHETCYAASRRPRLLGEIRAYRRLAERYLRIALTGEAALTEDIKHQEAFCSACIARDPADAERTARFLLEWTIDKVGAVLAAMDGFG